MLETGPFSSEFLRNLNFRLFLIIMSQEDLSKTPGEAEVDRYLQLLVEEGFSPREGKQHNHAAIARATHRYVECDGPQLLYELKDRLTGR